MMHHEKKETGHWKTMYSVVKDLNVLKQVQYLILSAYNGDTCIAFRKQA